MGTRRSGGDVGVYLYHKDPHPFVSLLRLCHNKQSSVLRLPPVYTKTKENKNNEKRRGGEDDKENLCKKVHSPKISGPEGIYGCYFLL